jgi:hypothetical protein
MKFTTPNIVVANPIPDETRIYYSKDTPFAGMIFSIIPLGFGINFLFQGVDYIAVTLICFIAAIGVFYMQFKVFTDESPQIILNKKGIQTAYKPFYTWQQINEIDIDSMFAGRGGRPYFLVYKTSDNEKVEVKINNLNIDEPLLRNLLCYYSLYENP